LLFTVTSTTDFTPPPPPQQKLFENWFVMERFVYRTLKSENSQEYDQNPQQICTFVNSASIQLRCQRHSKYVLKGEIVAIALNSSCTRSEDSGQYCFIVFSTVQ
jgi:hypothetical protein